VKIVKIDKVFSINLTITEQYFTIFNLRIVGRALFGRELKPKDILLPYFCRFLPNYCSIQYYFPFRVGKMYEMKNHKVECLFTIFYARVGDIHAIRVSEVKDVLLFRKATQSTDQFSITTQSQQLGKSNNPILYENKFIILMKLMTIMVIFLLKAS
jgi:hypothetical protein